MSPRPIFFREESCVKYQQAVEKHNKEMKQECERAELWADGPRVLFCMHQTPAPRNQSDA